MSSSRNRSSKILVLTVDLDDDLGRIGINTPVIGYVNVLNTANSLGIGCPSDSDLNAIFQALKIYNELKNSGRDVEIAILSGKYGDLSSSTMRVYEDLERIRDSIGFEYIYFVSDGAYDEQVLPVLNSIARVIGVSRVVVMQSRNIEETYLLIGKYLKKALTEQPYAKFSLGIPGLILILYVLSTLIGFTKYVWEIVALLIGIVLFAKGFGFIDRIFIYWRITPILGLIYGSALVLLSYSIMVSIMLSIIYGFTIITLKLIVNIVFLIFIVGSILIVISRIFYRVVEGKAYMVWRDALLFIPIVFFIAFINNLYQRLIGIEEGISSEELLTIVFRQDVFVPLVSTILSLVVFSIVFVILDYIILKKSTTKPSLS